MNGASITLAPQGSSLPMGDECQSSLALECGRLIDQYLRPPAFPEVGQSLGDFLVLAELGRGAVGRVYLATQPALAGRPVVLKVTPRHDGEFLSLGRLQHTNIIPLHAVYDFPERNLQALCQPYFGGADLARVLGALKAVPFSERTGQALVEALDKAASGPSLAGHGGPRGLLARASYAQAICWIAASLADALQHAHERGLVHLDLKPSNVLLAADGQPLLLDFHLTQPALQAGQMIPKAFGGTRGYMSPEQWSAYGAAICGLPLPATIGPRSDIFSLGRLLYVALGGDESHAFDDPPPLRRRNPQVSAGLENIVRRCLKKSPDDRYPTAAALAVDLRRHLADQPLRGVSSGGVRERWQKWRRRRPYAPLWTGLVMALVAVPLFLIGAATERIDEARVALATGQELFQRRQFAEAARTLARGKSRIDLLPGCRGLSLQLDGSLRRAEQAAAVEHLHAVAEQLRFMVGDDLFTRRDLQALDAHWRLVWQRRALLSSFADGPAHAVAQARLDLADLAELRIDLDGRLGRSSSEFKDAAEQVAGSAAEVDRDAAWWKHSKAGRAALRAGSVARAAAEFAQTAALRPSDFWAHFYGGVCAHRLGRHAEAVQAFTVALALAPDAPEVYYNRAVAQAAAGDQASADRDFARAHRLEPALY